MALTDKLTAIADALRANTGSAETLTLDAMPGAVEAVYRAGSKAVWQTIQQGGQRSDYAYAFYGWDSAGFYPVYSMTPTSMNRMFSAISGQNWDLRQRLSDCGVTLDTGSCTGFVRPFYDSKITCLPPMDVTGGEKLEGTFYGLPMHTLEKLKVAAYNTFDSFAFRCQSLENIVIEGVIGSDVDFHYCTKLTQASLLSILSALKDFSGTDTTCVLTLGSENLEKLTDAQKASATEKGWSLA